MAVVYSDAEIRDRLIPAEDAQIIAEFALIHAIEQDVDGKFQNVAGAMVYGSGLVNMTKPQPNLMPGSRRDVDFLVVFDDTPTEDDRRAIRELIDDIYELTHVRIDIHTLTARVLNKHSSFERDLLLAHHLREAELAGRNLNIPLATGVCAVHLRSIDDEKDPIDRQMIGAQNVLEYFREKGDSLFKMPAEFDEQTGYKAMTRLLELRGAVLRKLHDLSAVFKLIPNKDGLPFLTSRADDPALMEVLGIDQRGGKLADALRELGRLNDHYEHVLAYANEPDISDEERAHRLAWYRNWVRGAYRRALSASTTLITGADKLVADEFVMTGDEDMY